MNVFSWVISGEHCNHVRRADLSAPPPRGSWGGSLLFAPLHLGLWALSPHWTGHQP